MVTNGWPTKHCAGTHAPHTQLPLVSVIPWKPFPPAATNPFDSPHGLGDTQNEKSRAPPLSPKAKRTVLPATDDMSAAPFHVTACRTLSEVSGAQLPCVKGAIGAPLLSKTATVTEPCSPGFVAMLTKKCLPLKVRLCVTASPVVLPGATSIEAKPARTDIAGTLGRVQPRCRRYRGDIAYRRGARRRSRPWHCR